MSEAETIPLFLGIDGGGSKTLAVIVDEMGNERGRGIAGSSNHEVVGLERAVAAIHEAVAIATAAARTDLPVTAAWMGLAGIDHPRDVAILIPAVRSFAGSVQITNDAELVLSALPHQVGVAVISGTGSIALGRDSQGTLVRAGGWGHVLGDEGSGFSIGREALQCAVRAADGRGPETALLERILRHWQIPEPEALLERVYPTFDKTAIAALAPMVLALARAGDSVARGIEARAAHELALAVIAVARRLGYVAGRLPVAFGGGVLIHEERLRTLVIRRVARTWSVDPVLVEEPASSAARALVERGPES
ncbi:MAG TPA: BadF/BadG/BcrA/BcrD ATPase family protein [Ktedonobacterales bacterium]|nr:BadF/BadG/BcrA/BcrD ATPase family protein [Ktedonobacterales bacterium]